MQQIYLRLWELNNRPKQKYTKIHLSNLMYFTDEMAHLFFFKKEFRIETDKEKVSTHLL